MAQYRKKPVVIEAVQWNSANFDEVAEFVGDNAWFSPDGELYIYTLEGEMHAADNDYIIKGVKGEHYPCKPDIFEMTYEKVED